MFRIVLLIVALSAVTGCIDVVKSATAPTPPIGVSAEDVKIHSFNLGAFTEIQETQVVLPYTYQVTAQSCVIMVFRGVIPDDTQVIGGGDVSARAGERSSVVVIRRIPGEHLVELRCVHDPRAQTGPIEKRYINIP